jgi:tetratricopeptide (TPR) repeat protein/transcriptional regulator with XRE-family HTH domain
VAQPPVMTFARLLRQLRVEAGLTQEELAEAAGLSPRSVSDLERGVAHSARKETARLLAGALGLTGAARGSFEAAARGRAQARPSPALATRITAVAAATRTLPRDIVSFTGREPELRELVGVSTTTPHSGGVVGIHAIGGMAGIGKTTFAVHAAHQLAPRFPDGQIFLPLHGHTPGQQPVDPSDALASLLLTAGVAAGQIPPGLEERTALWRDHLAGKQLLLLLDDAADSEQIRPLLPGTAGSLVLVTSRRHLTALEDAQAVSLGTLAEDEAAELLVRLAARSGLSSSDEAVAEITRLCGYLPLAVGMLARQLHHHPAWTVTELAADLAAARDRLELMHTENLSVAAAFDLSYQDLAPDQKQLFRRLGLHPGTDIDAYTAAALDGTDLATARRHLDTLYDQYLIAEHARGRYHFHDLIREHSRALVARDQAPERNAATSRLFDYYTHVGAVAERQLARQRRPEPDPAALLSTQAAVPNLPDRAHALAWARAERANLLACLDHVTGTNRHAQVVALTAALSALLRLDGPWTDAITHHTASIQAARQLGDRLSEANAHHDLGDMRYLTSDYPGATQELEKALSTYRDLGNQLGQANTLNHLGVVRILTADYPGATRELEEALSLYRDLGDRLGEANTLLDVGAVQYETGDIPGAFEAHQIALGLYLDLGNRHGQANALADLANVRTGAGDYAGATQAIEQALAIYLELGDRFGRAHALNALGNVRRMTGDYEEAAQMLYESVDIYLSLGGRMNMAIPLVKLAAVQAQMGNYSDSAKALEDALGIFRDLRDRDGETEALNEIGILQLLCGRLDKAGACHHQALELARQIGNPWNEARALAGLGRYALAVGNSTEAQADLKEAVEIFQRIGAAEATSVAAELGALTEPKPASEGTL